MGFTFDVIPPRVADERSFIDSTNLTSSVRNLARRKAESVAEHHTDALVLGTDTVVVVDTHVLGKPEDETEGRRMLERLSGRSHQVLSGIALVCRDAAFAAGDTVTTSVRFRAVPRSEIDDYLAHAEYRDKAGAYGIQDAAMVFVEAIEGCYYNVVGLPVTATIRLFETYQTHREHPKHVQGR